MTKVMKDLVGRKIRLSTGERELVVKVTQRHGYETESGYTVAPEDLVPSGRGFKEIDKPVSKKKVKEEPEQRTRKTRGSSRTEEKETRSSRRENRARLSEETEKPVRERKIRSSREEEPTKSKRRVSRKEEEPAKLKKVVKITDELSEHVRSFFHERIGDLIREMGYAFKPVVVLPEFSDEALNVNIVLMPTNATDKDRLRLAKLYKENYDNAEEDEEEEDQNEDTYDSDFDGDEEEPEEESEEDEDDESEEEPDENDVEEEEEPEDLDSLIEMVCDDTGLSPKKISKYVEEWLDNTEVMEDNFGDEVKVGMLMRNEENREIYIVGYSESKNMVVVWDQEKEKIVGMKIGAVAKFEEVVPEEDDELHDGEDGEFFDEDEIM